MPGKIACGRLEGMNFCIGCLGVICRYLQFTLCERVRTGMLFYEPFACVVSVGMLCTYRYSWIFRVCIYLLFFLLLFFVVVVVVVVVVGFSY
jgi:hypothetical protein